MSTSMMALWSVILLLSKVLVRGRILPSVVVRRLIVTRTVRKRMEAVSSTTTGVVWHLFRRASLIWVATSVGILS